MRILSSYIQGFGPHKSLSTQWSDYPSVTPVIAENGAGKTSIIGAPFAAIFGGFPSYKGNIYKALTENGSRIMRILSSYIQGFGPHKSLSTPWSDYRSVTPVIAENGAGKTFMIEAPFAAIFGDFPSYKGNIYKALTENGNGQGRVETVVEIKGKVFKIVRIVSVSASGKTKDNTAVVLEGPGFIENPPFKGPKQRDFDFWVKTHIGTRELAEATWFSCYRSDKDLCELLPSKRSDLIGDFINVSSLGEIAKSAKSQKQVSNTRASLIGSQIRDQDPNHDISERIISESEKEEIVNQQIATLNGDISRIKKEEDKILDSLSELTAKMGAASKYTEAQVQLEKLIASGETFRAEVERLKNISVRIPELEAIRKKADDTLERSREMQAFFDAKMEVYKARTTLEAAEAELERIPSPIDTAAIEREIESIRSKNAPTTARIKALEVKRAELMQQTPPGLAEVLDEIEQKNTEMRLWSDQIMGLQKSLKSETENAGRRDIITSKVNTLRGVLESVKPGDTEYTREQLEAERDLYMDLSRQASGLDDAKSAAESVPKMEEELAFIKRDILNKQDLLEAHEPDENLIEEHDRLVLLARKTRDQKTELQTLLMTQQSGANNHAMEIKSLRYVAEKVGILNEKMKVEQDNEGRLAIIERAFGRSGVQSILIESAIKPFEMMASTMLQQATGGANDLRIETVKENQDGTTREEISILISSHTGERDVYQYSGGQRRIFSTIIRLALARWISLRSGYSYGTIFLDEAFDSLSPKNTARLITLLGNVSTHFDNIIVVTPDRQKVLQLPEKIEI